MANLIENRAYVEGRNSGRRIYFLDTSWKKTRRCKLYEGFRLGPFMEEQRVVLKVYNDNYMSEEDCDGIIDDYQMLDNLAKDFNKKTEPQTKIRVLVPEKAIIDKLAEVHTLKKRRRTLSKEEWILVFRKIDPNFKTFVRKDGSGNGYQDVDAFVHFVYHQTNYNVMLSKLHGIVRNGTLIITCPRVFSRDGQIGFRNRDLVDTVFGNHNCNKLCGVVVDDRATPSAPLCEDNDNEDDVLGWNLDENPFVGVPYDDSCSSPPPYSHNCPEGHTTVSEDYLAHRTHTIAILNDNVVNYLNQNMHRLQLNFNDTEYS